MSENSLPEQLEQLRQLINYHNYRYHTLDLPEISDFEFDKLYNKLKLIESENPELITPDSPTQRSGATPLTKFQKVNHPAPILSLANGFGRSDTLNWFERILKLDPAVKDTKFLLEPKLDGLTVVLHYREGKLVLGATRGDGVVGEDITNNLKTIPTIPLRIPVSGSLLPPDLLVLRGEVFITKADFKKLNSELEQKGEKAYLNPRNTAAGSLRQLDPEITSMRPLKTYLYQVVFSSSPLPKTQSGILEFLEDLGFPVNPLRWLAKDIYQAIETCEAQAITRHTWPYDADGVVIKINDLGLAQKLGFVGKDPRGAIAFKYPGLEAETTLKDIQINVGRTGILTPLAILEPVSIGGVVVKQATLHNFDFIREKDIRIGDAVLLKRAGEVIPYILGPLLEKRTGKELVYFAPSICPSCGEKVVRFSEEVAYFCTNSSCPAQRARIIENFVSRSAMDINGLGAQIVQQLVDADLINSPADLYDLRYEDLTKLDKFGDQKANNLLEAIEASKKQPLERLIIGLGIRGVGEVAARKLAQKYRDLDSLSQALIRDLEELEGFGPNIASSIQSWFSQSQNQEILKKLKRLKVWPTESTNPALAIKQKLENKTFVLTGTLENYSRDAVTKLIESNGGKVSSSVRKKTDFVVVGAEPGSKYDNAVRLGIKILDESELIDLLSSD